MKSVSSVDDSLDAAADRSGSVQVDGHHPRPSSRKDGISDILSERIREQNRGDRRLRDGKHNTTRTLRAGKPMKG